jgi:serine phosphatase RsbU (regulator of sigma subunit)
MQKLLILLISFLSISSLFSQAFYPPIDNYTSRDYGKDQVPENFAVVQDHRGVVYAGNSGAVLEYDGSSWRIISVVSGALVRALAVDESGLIYVGTSGDFGRLIPDVNGDLVYESLIDSLTFVENPFSEIWNVSYLNNHVYFQANELIYDYDVKTKQLNLITTKTSFHTSFVSDGQLFIREREVGLVVYKNEELITLKNGGFFKDFGVFGVVKDGNTDTSLIVTQEMGLWRLVDNEVIPFECENSEYFNQMSIIGATRLSDNNIAINTLLAGLFIIDFEGNIVKRINKRTGLRVNAVNNVYEDKDNNIWLALGNGIAKVNYNSPLSFYNEKSGLMGGVKSVLKYKGHIFVGTSNGLFVQNKDVTSKSEFTKLPDIHDPVWDLKVVENKVWIGAENETFIMDENFNIRRKSYNGTNRIYFDESEAIAITAGVSGIFVYDSKTENEIFSVPGPLRTISNIEKETKPTIDGHQYWLSSMNYAVIRLSKNNSGFYLDAFNSMDGLEEKFIAKPLIYNGQVVFGTTSGILRFVSEEEVRVELPDSLKDDPDFARGFFDVHPLYDSVYSGSTIYDIIESKDRTWAAINGQVGYFDKKTKEYVKKPFWGIDYGRINGFYIEDDGTLWICAADGLIRFRDNKNKVYNSDFNTIIRSVYMMGDSLIFNGAFLSEDGTHVSIKQSSEPVVIEYANNSMKFVFAAPYFEDNHKITYQYKLEGYDQKWSMWTANTEAVYTNLHEGEYVFKVRSKNVYGTISEVSEYKFTISPPWYRTMWAYVLFGIGVILLILIIVRVSMARLKAKNIWLEGVVAERTKEIADKNVVLETQKDEILHQKIEIEDSINYAKRIQNAILPLESNIKLNLPESFVLFQPKDIVSGDFYWFANQNDKIIFVCADCTGHGVPGAFMSMIGSDKINTAVLERGVTMPDAILTELNVGIKKSLKQEGGDKESTKDGMDAAIVTIDLKTKKLYYSGANRPLWILKDNEIEEIKATKVAVAGFTPDDQIFQIHEIDIKPGDTFYMSSDGYADQFGGERGKKLKVKAMKQILLENKDLPMEEQRNQLDQKMSEWMDGYEQIDDICVIGIKIV